MQEVIAERYTFNKNIPKRSPQNRHLGARNFKVIAMFFLIIAVVISYFLFHAWSNIQVVNLGYEISRANKERKELLYLNKKLKLEMATLKSPHYVEGIAKRELRLTSPKPDQLVIIK